MKTLLRSCRPVIATSALVAALALAGCSSPGTTARTGSADAPTGSATALSGSITVFAAASLQQTFTELGDRFEREHPGTTVTFSFAGSSDLVSQIRNGAPADVFASADEATMDEIATTDLAADARRDFATNTLEIAVAPGNPEGIRDLDDLTRPGLQVVTCAAPVPCGAATAKLERAAGVDLRPVSEEQSVTDVLGKVESGQADAGLVYVTDVEGSDGKVDGVRPAAASKVVNTYPIGVLTGSSDPALATAFTDFVLSDAGQRVLADAGFGKP